MFDVVHINNWEAFDVFLVTVYFNYKIEDQNILRKFENLIKYSKTLIKFLKHKNSL